MHYWWYISCQWDRWWQRRITAQKHGYKTSLKQAKEKKLGIMGKNAKTFTVPNELTLKEPLWDWYKNHSWYEKWKTYQENLNTVCLWNSIEKDWTKYRAYVNWLIKSRVWVKEIQYKTTNPIQIKQGQQSLFVSYSAWIIPASAGKYIMDQTNCGTDKLIINQIVLDDY